MKIENSADINTIEPLHLRQASAGPIRLVQTPEEEIWRHSWLIGTRLMILPWMAVTRLTVEEYTYRAS